MLKPDRKNCAKEIAKRKTNITRDFSPNEEDNDIGDDDIEEEEDNGSGKKGDGSQSSTLSQFLLVDGQLYEDIKDDRLLQMKLDILDDLIKMWLFAGGNLKIKRKKRSQADDS